MQKEGKNLFCQTLCGVSSICPVFPAAGASLPNNSTHTNAHTQTRTFHSTALHIKWVQMSSYFFSTRRKVVSFCNGLVALAELQAQCVSSWIRRVSSAAIHGRSKKDNVRRKNRKAEQINEYQLPFGIWRGNVLLCFVDLFSPFFPTNVDFSSPFLVVPVS